VLIITSILAAIFGIACLIAAIALIAYCFVLATDGLKQLDGDEALAIIVLVAICSIFGSNLYYLIIGS